MPEKPNADLTREIQLISPIVRDLREMSETLEGLPRTSARIATCSDLLEERVTAIVEASQRQARELLQGILGGSQDDAPQRSQRSFRFPADTLEDLKRLQKDLRLSGTAVMILAIRMLHKKECLDDGR